MKKQNYLEMLNNRVRVWRSDLATLQDDVDRADEDSKEDYMSTMADLYRSFEDVESRLDEIDEMTAEEFEDEKEVMDEKMADFEEALTEARETIKDI